MSNFFDKNGEDESAIIRIQRVPSNFITVHKGFINDSRLTLKAVGLLCYLLSKPDGWKVIVSDIVKNFANGKPSVYSGLKELKRYGYYKKEAVRENGRIVRWESIVYECPPDRQTPSDPPAPTPPKAPKNGGKSSDIPHVDSSKVDKENIKNKQRNYININKNKSTKSDVSIYRGESEKNKITDTAPPPDKTDTNPIKTYTREEVADKIALDEIKNEHEDKHEEADMLYNVVCEVLTVDNPPSPTFRVSRQNIPYITVKNAFAKLEKKHIEYVIDCLNKNNNKFNIKCNTKSYLMTALFNSIRTITYYFNRSFTPKIEEKSTFERLIEQKIERDRLKWIQGCT